jgi:hypothetical protein
MLGSRGPGGGTWPASRLDELLTLYAYVRGPRIIAR